jgi:hypothetical protein
MVVKVVFFFKKVRFRDPQRMLMSVHSLTAASMHPAKAVTQHSVHSTVITLCGETSRGNSHQLQPFSVQYKLESL